MIFSLVGGDWGPHSCLSMGLLPPSASLISPYFLDIPLLPSVSKIRAETSVDSSCDSSSPQFNQRLETFSPDPLLALLSPPLIYLPLSSIPQLFMHI